MNKYSPRHPHEPEIPPAIGPTGYCAVCTIMTNLSGAKAENQALTTKLAAAEAVIAAAERMIDTMVPLQFIELLRYRLTDYRAKETEA